MSAGGFDPEALARALLARFGITPPFDLDDLCRQIGLSVREVDSEGFEGALLRAAGRAKGIIAVSRGVPEEGRRRFTVAHEIGHYLLPQHGTHDAVCSGDEIEAWNGGVSLQEQAANRFASELLLPAAQVRPLVAARSVSIETARFVSREFYTSLFAAALKCVEVADLPCAVVVSAGGVVSRSKANRRFPYEVTRGRVLRSDALAWHLPDGAESGGINGTVSASAWADRKGGTQTSDTRLHEDSLLLPHYDSVLTILAVSVPGRPAGASR